MRYVSDFTTQAAQIVGTNNVVLAAGNILTAGNLVHITGSDVMSGTAIIGKDVTIDAAVPGDLCLELD